MPGTYAPTTKAVLPRTRTVECTSLPSSPDPAPSNRKGQVLPPKTLSIEHEMMPDITHTTAREWYVYKNTNEVSSYDAGMLTLASRLLSKHAGGADAKAAPSEYRRLQGLLPHPAQGSPLHRHGVLRRGRPKHANKKCTVRQQWSYIPGTVQQGSHHL